MANPTRAFSKRWNVFEASIEYEDEFEYEKVLSGIGLNPQGDGDGKGGSTWDGDGAGDPDAAGGDEGDRARGEDFELVSVLLKATDVCRARETRNRKPAIAQRF